MRKKQTIQLIGLLLCAMVALLPAAAYANTIGDLPLEKGAEGTGVIILQQRLMDLGYLHFRPTGFYGEMTKVALQNFQKRNGLKGTGILDQETYVKLFAKSVRRGGIGPAIRRVVGPRLLAVAKQYGELTPWREIDILFPAGARATVQDLYTGYTYQVTRAGGRNHAHVQPVTEGDAATYQKCFGGSSTWEKRPAVVTIEGVAYAASVFGYPNWAESAGGALDGSICIYFFESGSDIGGVADSEHTTNIYLASQQAGTER